MNPQSGPSANPAATVTNLPISEVRKIYVIGIGAGSPDFLTQQARAAIAACPVFLVPEKRTATAELVAVREAICAQIKTDPYEIHRVPDPVRATDDTPYVERVANWHAQRVEGFAQVIAEYDPKIPIGFLVWGDPAFYDSTIRIVDSLAQKIPTEVQVIPGITAFQALAARCGIVLHSIGQPVHITTGRRLRQDAAALTGQTLVVMLDAHLQCEHLLGQDWHIYWGAYLGLPHEEIVSGPLDEVFSDIQRKRAQLRTEKGWIMDVYALIPRTN